MNALKLAGELLVALAPYRPPVFCSARVFFFGKGDDLLVSPPDRDADLHIERAVFCYLSAVSVSISDFACHHLPSVALFRAARVVSKAFLKRASAASVNLFSAWAAQR